MTATQERQLVAVLGKRIGDVDPSVRTLNLWLARFGYLPEAHSTDDHFGTHTQEALRALQTFYGLSVTGEPDVATVAVMLRPRCGSSDLPSNGSQRPRWPASHITYSFRNYVSGLPESDVTEAISEAFGLWSRVTRLSFSERRVAGDIAITFEPSSAGNLSIRGPWQITAHTSFAPNESKPVAYLHLDSTRWDVALPSEGDRFDLQTTAAHQIGHLLGLSHSPGRETLMFPLYTGPHRFLAPSDITAIREIYGRSAAGLG